jgi:hypothetical protein
VDENTTRAKDNNYPMESLTNVQILNAATAITTNIKNANPHVSKIGSLNLEETFQVMITA